MIILLIRVTFKKNILEKVNLALYDYWFLMYILDYRIFYKRGIVGFVLMRNDRWEEAVSDLENDLPAKRPGTVVFWGGGIEVRKELARRFHDRTGISVVTSSSNEVFSIGGYSVGVFYFDERYGLSR